MIIEQGQVIATSDNRVWVETIRKSACHSCTARSGCGQAVLGQMMDEKKQYQKNILRVNAENQTFQVGEIIEIGIEEGALLKTAALTYGVPILLLFLFSAVGQWMKFPDLAVALAGGVGLYSGFYWVRKIVASWDCDARYHPELLHSK